MPIIWGSDDSPYQSLKRRLREHRHVCACGHYLVCRAHPDQCSPLFECPTCVQDQLDAWADTRAKEPTRHEHQ